MISHLSRETCGRHYFRLDIMINVEYLEILVKYCKHSSLVTFGIIYHKVDLETEFLFILIQLRKLFKIRKN